MTEKILYEQLGIGRTRELTGEIILTYREALTAINYINTFPIFRTIGQYSHFSWDGHEVSWVFELLRPWA